MNYRKAQPHELKPPKRVLVVDAEPMVRKLMAKVLYRYLGCEVYTASKGKEAISFLYSNGFDLLLLDLDIVQMSGLELVRKIRALQPQIPLIVVTGDATEVDVLMIKKLGINQIIYKPFKIAAFLETIVSVLMAGEPLHSLA